MVYLLKNTEFNGIQNIQSRKELQNKQNQLEIANYYKTTKSLSMAKKNSLYVYVMLLCLIVRLQKYKKRLFWRGRTENKKALISLILLRASFMHNNGFEYTGAAVLVKNKLRHGGQYFKDYHSHNLSIDIIFI